MARVEFVIRSNPPDALVAARNAIFRAMFERAASALKLRVDSQEDDGNTELWVDDPTTDAAMSLLQLLGPLELLQFVVVTVESEQEQLAFSAFQSQVAIDLA